MPLGQDTIIGVEMEVRSVLKVDLGDGSTPCISPTMEKMVMHLTKIVEGIVVDDLKANTIITIVEKEAEG